MGELTALPRPLAGEEGSLPLPPNPTSALGLRALLNPIDDKILRMPLSHTALQPETAGFALSDLEI